MTALSFDHVSVTYPNATTPTLRDVTLAVPEGELCLVVGPTGTGKSTLLRAACGLVPHFTGGTLAGRVLVAGRDTRDHLPRDLADVVGVVGQDPAAGFVTGTVEDELAYAMEQLGVPGATMRTRVEEVLDLLGLAPLRDRPLADLSGGEQQRVAIGAVLTPHPRLLLLDEPTSALDPAAAEEVLAALTRLVHDLGMTVVIAEHRLERVVQYADHVVAVSPDGTVTDGQPAAMLALAATAPPIVELGRWAGWHPLPLSVRDARRRAVGLRTSLADVAPATVRSAGAALICADDLHVHHGGGPSSRALWRAGRPRASTVVHALRGVDLAVGAGEVLAVMGRNGAGKTSLLWALSGAGARSAGTVSVVGPDGAGGTVAGRVARRPVTRGAAGPAVTCDPAALPPAQARRLVALVPHDPAALLFRDTVRAELAAADADAPDGPGSAAAILTALAPEVSSDAHPRDLSEGGRLALALAVQLAARPKVLLLDEPTRGLDYAAKRRLTALLRRHAADGGAVILSSHDVEFVAETATRAVLLAAGEVVADGPAAQVLTASPTFAPQVARVLHPVPLLTVQALRRAVEEAS